MISYFNGSRNFKGVLSVDEHKLDVNFIVKINDTGEMILEIESILLGGDSLFIIHYFNDQKIKYFDFFLHGKSDDEVYFFSDDIYIYHMVNETPPFPLVILKVGFKTAKLHTVLSDHKKDFPIIRYYINGYIGNKTCVAKNHLGEIEMAGVELISNDDEKMSELTISSLDGPPDLEKWRMDVEDFFNNFRSIMSFASGRRLMVPAMEFIHDESHEIHVRAQIKVSSTHTPPFPFYDFSSIFKCAVDSYNDPRPHKEHLPGAIEWLNMNSNYDEGKLILAMTVLEYLVSSNLDKKDLTLRPKSLFRDLRNSLLEVVQEKISKWTEDPAERVSELNEIKDKFEDLNRRTLRQKIFLLADRWGVNIDDIPPEDIAEAKRARDHIVHQGHYTPSINSKKDIYDHVRLTRELATRFILTALDYKGSYISYLNGQEGKEFIISKPKVS